MTANTESALSLFESIGLSKQKAEETFKNKDLTATLLVCIEAAKRTNKITFGGDDKQNAANNKVGTLLYSVASKIKSQTRNHISLLVEYIVDRKIASEVQLQSALDYLLAHAVEGESIERAKLEEAFGCGVQVTVEEVEHTVGEVIARHRVELLVERYAKVGSLLLEVRTAGRLKWADGKQVKSEFDKQIEALLGPRNLADREAAKQKTAAPKTDAAASADADKKGSKSLETELRSGAVRLDTTGLVSADGHVKSFMEICGDATRFHKVGENYKTEGYVITPNSMRLLAQHVESIGGRVQTRFPPEPNGILHIGHAKAINFNFGYARANNGVCYLRYDDTNPEKEEEKYFVGIRDMVEWLGYAPWKITYASDYFEELYQLAVELIKRGHAYICHQRVEEIKGHNPPPSPWRERPIAESLALFEAMRAGKLAEGEATLRMKHIMEDSKVDPVAYRIKFVPHHRTGDQWCIYPTYDYTHCLNDSMENITHSLCTKEFQARRSSYYWLCNALDLYCPVQWEYGRLNLLYTVTSKRKILKLIEKGIVRDWDDPRLYTLTALRRRGMPPEAINMFVGKVGVTMSQTVISPSVLDACVRDVLNVKAPRCMAVMDPLRITIANLSEADETLLQVPNFPATPSRGAHPVAFRRTLYIDRCDFRENADSSFYRLTLNQPVGLRYTGYIISVREAKRNELGDLVELVCNAERVSEPDAGKPENDKASAKKVRTWVQWVADPLICEVRLYERLFKHENPEECPGGFLNDLHENTIQVLPAVYVDKSVTGAKQFTPYQFERIGFFAIDPDSTNELLVFNRTVTLKEDPGKKD